MAILNEDQLAVQQLVRSFAKKEIAPRAAHYDHSEEFPWDNIKGLAELGLMGMPIPEEYGGAGLDNLSYALAVEEVSKACAATGAIMSIHTSAGILPILLFGNEEQKRKYVPALAQGQKIGAFALTEPNAGSDAGAVSTTAKEDGESYVINGTKCFISNAGPAETYSVFASTNPGSGVKGITGFIVEKGTPGFSIGKKEEKMGIRASATAELVFDNCRVPKGNLLGNIGQGFKIAMVVLDSARIGVGAQAVGIAQAAYEEALAYAKVREQFGKPIAANQAIGFMLADMGIRIEAARQLVHYAANLKDSGAPFGKEAAMCKTFASDMSVQVALDAIQIMGGYGYSREYPVERLLRDAKITQIYEGTNQIQRVVIANYLLSERKG
jgi:alkylation response protein AidB-like acyl-CoA dehydrogenase